MVVGVKKIGFVIPWYDDKIPGGAEMELREVSAHLHSAGAEVEILTTCVKEFGSDWSENYHKPGESLSEKGIKIRGSSLHPAGYFGGRGRLS